MFIRKRPGQAHHKLSPVFLFTLFLLSPWAFGRGTPFYHSRNIIVHNSCITEAIISHGTKIRYFIFLTGKPHWNGHLLKTNRPVFVNGKRRTCFFLNFQETFVIFHTVLFYSSSNRRKNYFQLTFWKLMLTYVGPQFEKMETKRGRKMWRKIECELSK